MSRGDPELNHAVKVGISLEHTPDTGPGPILKLGLGPTSGANLGVVLGSAIRVASMTIHVVCIPSPQMNLCPEEE